MERFQKLLDVYTLEEILENLDLEEVDILQLLEDQGDLSRLTLPEPL